MFLEDSPKYPSPRSTFLMYEGKKLPAKHIRGMAYKIAHNQEISKEDYAGGMETVRFFERLGFEMYYMGTAISNTKVKLSRNHEKDVKKPQSDGNKLDIQNTTIKTTDIVEIPDGKIKISSKNVTEQKMPYSLY